jgi:hypothetical protein
LSRIDCVRVRLLFVGLRLCRALTTKPNGGIPANTDPRIPFQHFTRRQQHTLCNSLCSASVVTPSLYSATDIDTASNTSFAVS